MRLQRDASLAYHTAMRSLGHDWISRIGDRPLWLGALPLEELGDAKRLEVLEPRLVVSLLEDWETEAGWLYTPVKRYGAEHWKFSVRDHAPLGPPEWLHGQIAAANETVARGGPLFVHCRAGIRRSASFVTAYLMYSERLGFEKAYAEVRRWRAQVDINSEQRLALLAYEIFLETL